MRYRKNVVSKRLQTVILFVIISVFLSISSLPNAFARKKEEISDKKSSSTSSKTEEEAQKPAPVIPEYKGPKQRIAVMDFEDKTGQGAVGQGMTEMLITSLHETGRFIVVERNAIIDVITEQDFGETGRVNPETAAKIGNILGAQVLIRGAVTEYEANAGAKAGGISIKGITLGGGGKTAHVAVDIRIYDAGTGVVLESHRSVGQAKTKAMLVGAAYKGIGIGGAGFEKTPLGQAARQAIQDMVDFVVQKMQDRPWQARVVKVEGDTIFVNAGEDSGISVGNTFVVYSMGEELIDPETGLSLGGEKTKCGEIQISSIQPKFSKAIIVSGSGFKRNDIIEAKP